MAFSVELVKYIAYCLWLLKISGSSYDKSKFIYADNEDTTSLKNNSDNVCI